MKTLAVLTLLVSIYSNAQMKQPEAKQIPTHLSNHGYTRVDNYFWMNQRDSKEVLNYISEENAYSAHFFDSKKVLINQLLQEFETRIDPNEKTAPFTINKNKLQYQSIEGKDYRVLNREINGKWEVFFDENKRAEGKKFYQLGAFDFSSNNEIFAFSEDELGRRKFTIRFMKTADKTYLKDEIKLTDGSVYFANDNKTVYYAKKDEQTLREFQIWKHTLGTNSKEDQLIFQEDDERFAVYLTKSIDHQFLFIHSVSSTTSEVHLIDANNPAEKIQVYQQRKAGVLYELEHNNGQFYVLTNDNSPNRKLIQQSNADAPSTELVAHNPKAYIEEFIVLQNHVIVHQRIQGASEFNVLQLTSKEWKTIPFDEEVYEVSFGLNDNPTSESFEYRYQSFTTPSSLKSVNLSNLQTETIFTTALRDQKFSPDLYESKRIWARANDGELVPISLVYKKGIDLSKAPLLLYGYGSYGFTIPCTFSATRLSLLDRGFVYAIAHIRGGKFLGEEWYQQGKLMQKRHTFSDFINAAEWLAMKGIGDPNNYFAQGGSAGGLLMGAVANAAPHRFKGIIAQVPFVDVVTTMLDETIPLTVGEYEEWGNPNEKEAFEYMLSYSPYDNVRAMNYPNMLITTGYHDSQVQYWEPLKWIAKLRDYNTGSNQLYFDCSMDAGHGGASGKTSERLETAKEMAFLISIWGEN